MCNSKQSQKHSQECYVLAILRYLYPDRYFDVVLGERPDLQGNKVGVEVTICEDSEEIRVNREFVQYCEGNNKDIRRKTIQKSGRYKIENRMNMEMLVSGGGVNFQEKDILHATIRKKISSVSKYSNNSPKK